jgi:hypothetical protein
VDGVHKSSETLFVRIEDEDLWLSSLKMARENIMSNLEQLQPKQQVSIIEDMSYSIISRVFDQASIVDPRNWTG